MRCAVLGGCLAALLFSTAGCKRDAERNTYGSTQYLTDFSKPDELAEKWRCYDGGKWAIRDGSLFGDARPTTDGRSILWLDEPFVEDIQVEYEAEVVDKPSDLNCIIGGNGKTISGYEIIVGGFGNEKIAIYKNVVDGESTSRNRLIREDFSVEKGHVYEIKVKRYRNEFRVYVDNELILRKTDSEPISDKQHRYFGFCTFQTVVRFDNLKIEKKD